MNDLPEKKTPKPLDEKYPNRYERVCELLNKYAEGTHEYNLSENYLENHEGEAIWDQTDGSLNSFGLLESAHIAVALTYKRRKQLESQSEEAANDENYLLDLVNACKEEIRFAGFPSYTAYLNSEHWQQVREEAIERAGVRCMLCNRDDETLHVHHRTYERLGNEDPMDVIVLCATHHTQFHGKDGNE